MNYSATETNIQSLVMNLLLAVIIIVGLFLILRTISNFFNNKLEFAENVEPPISSVQDVNINSVVQQTEQKIDMVATVQQGNVDSISPPSSSSNESTQNGSEGSTGSVNLSANASSAISGMTPGATDATKLSVSASIPVDQSNSPVVANVISNVPITVSGPPVPQEFPISRETKASYNKYDIISLPASIDGPDGYIGRDYVCYRGRASDKLFMSKRGNCMACQVDKRNDGKNKNIQTQTNVITTCVYGSDDDHKADSTVWTKQMCIDACKKLQDDN